MPAFVHVPCPCGREVRVRPDQSGTSVRCWNCGREVEIKVRNSSRLAEACATAGREAFRLHSAGFAMAWGLLTAILLAIPYAGLYLAFASLMLGAWRYQNRMLGVSEEIGLTSPAEAASAPPRRRGHYLLRFALSALAAAGLVSPFIVRNGGHLVPGDMSGALSFRWMLVAFAVGWILVPLVIVLFSARDADGPINPLRVFGRLAKHPSGVVAALLLFPFGMLVVETILGVLAAEQGMLSVLISDLFPTPSIVVGASGTHMLFDYDGLQFKVPFSSEVQDVFHVYLAGLSRGHSLVATVPLSLATRIDETRIDSSNFLVSREHFLIFRIVFAWLALSAAGILLSIQARWLGLAASIDRAGSVPKSTDSTWALTPANGRQEAREVSDSGHPPVLPPPPSLSTTPYPAPGPAAPVAMAAPVSFANFPATPSSPLPAVAVEPLIQNGPPGSPRILIIDDERAFAHALAKILAGRGFSVLLAADAAEGLRLALSSQPDLIVLDLLLPDRPGLDLCRDLRSTEPTRDVPIVMATYKSGADDEIAGLTQGADDYIAKPYVVEVLIARIQKQLSRRRLRA